MRVVSRQYCIKPKVAHIESTLGSYKSFPCINDQDYKAISAYYLLQTTKDIPSLQPIESDYIYSKHVNQWLMLYSPENKISSFPELRSKLRKIISDWQTENLIYIDENPYGELRLVYFDQAFMYLDEPFYVSKQKPNLCFFKTEDNRIIPKTISLTQYSNIVTGILYKNDLDAIDYYRRNTSINASNSKITDILLDYLDSAWLFLPITTTMIKFLYSLNGLDEPSELTLSTILELTKDCSMEEVSNLIKNTSNYNSASLDLPEL